MVEKRVKIKDKEIILVGTAHISQKSAEQVKELIEKENPDIVGIELDMSRMKQLKEGKKWENTNIFEIIKSGNTYLFLINTLLSNMQKQLGDKVGVKPGQEMIEAIKAAEEKQKPIQLLDRDLRITMKRAMKKITLKEKLKLLIQLFEAFIGTKTNKEAEEITREKIEEMKKEDMLNKLMNELGKEMPSIKEVLVDERDQYIAEQLKISPGKKILAVVGAGHLQGIIENLEKENNLKELNTIPNKISILKILKYAIPALIIVFFAYAFLTKGIETLTEMFAYWFIINGVLSALGVILVRGHILSAIAAFVAAPFTSLHPAIAAGWVAGAVETKLRTPKVKDFNQLQNIVKLKDYTKNPVTRILLVVAAANLGSSLGTIIAIPFLAQLLI